MEKKARFLTLEDYFEHHEQEVQPLLGRRLAMAAWSLMHADVASDDGIGVCKRVQKALDELVGDRPARWEAEVSENHKILDLMRWIDELSEKGALSKDEECGVSDIDLNFESQKTCAVQMSEFHKATWAVERMRELYDPAGFEVLEPLEFKYGTSLAFMIDALDRDMKAGVSNSNCHPQKMSVSVGALTLVMPEHEGKPEVRISVCRRFAQNDIPRIVSELKELIDERNKELGEAIKQYQENLKLVPEGWPSEEGSKKVEQWAWARFHGDNGLVGSEFFEGQWLRSYMPSDLHRETLLPDPEDKETVFFYPGRKPSEPEQPVDAEAGGEAEDAGCAAQGQKPWASVEQMQSFTALCLDSAQAMRAEGPGASSAMMEKLEIEGHLDSCKNAGREGGPKGCGM